MINRDKLALVQTVYVLGLQQVGGCWSPNGEAYLRYEDAHEELVRLKAKHNGITEVIFTFHVYAPREITT